jgi:hypothetical protein
MPLLYNNVIYYKIKEILIEAGICRTTFYGLLNNERIPRSNLRKGKTLLYTEQEKDDIIKKIHSIFPLSIESKKAQEELSLNNKEKE